MVLKRSSSYEFIQRNNHSDSFYHSDSFLHKKHKSCNNLSLMCNTFYYVKNEYTLDMSNVTNKFAKLNKYKDDNNLLYNDTSVSYGEFLLKNPHATKKQRIQAVKRFYDALC